MKAELSFKILGPLEVLRAHEELDLGPHKQSSLLALLVLNANQVVSVDRIADALWGDEAAGKENAIWVYVSRLRSILEPDRTARGESSVLLTKEPGYALAIDTQGADHLRFEELVSAARLAAETSAERAVSLLDEALALWRGNALADFEYEEFARASIERLEGLRLEATELRFDALLAQGHAGDLVTGLEAFARDNPYREQPVGQLMVALYRTGRQTEALRAFERHRRIVGDEFGLDPSPTLQRLEEQILLHDRALSPEPHRQLVDAGSQPNPYKGLHAFRESDEGRFFGRESLVAELIRRLAGGDRLVAVVGPSGSGKSSVVNAGLVPQVRKGGIGEEIEWLVAQMVPGAHPFSELEAALLRTRLDAPDSLTDQLAAGDRAVLRACLRVLPGDGARLLIVIDQFEELFNLVEDSKERERFLQGLVLALGEPHGRIVVVLTLRADFYDRPLQYPDFAALLDGAVVNVTPLASNELEAAASKPAATAGVRLEPALVARLIADVLDEPGALPMFQYTLTELYERRSGDALLESGYEELGGVRGAITNRAEELYRNLKTNEQAAGRQLFLRLVSMSGPDTWNRRRVRADEIISLDVDVVTLQAVIDRFGAHRLLFFDRDAVTGSPTVEIGHEALLDEWPRFKQWIQEADSDLRRLASFVNALDEWERAGKDPGFLVSGARLAAYEQWSRSSSIELNARELEFLSAAVDGRAAALRADRERFEREASLASRARRRLWGLVAAVAALVAVVALVLIAVPSDERPRAALVHAGADSMNGLTVVGLEEAGRRFDVEIVPVTPPWTSVENAIRALAESGTELIITDRSLASGAMGRLAPEFPDTQFVVIFGRADSDIPNYTTYEFADRESAYLAGVAAALESKSGTVGFVGAFAAFDPLMRLTGFEAGVRSIDPSTEILVRYLVASGQNLDAFSQPNLGQSAAADLFERGADVVYHAAGSSGEGVFKAAREAAERTGRGVWGIGTDSDQFYDVPAADAEFVLMSTIRRFDELVIDAVERLTSADFATGAVELSLASGGLDYTASGDNLAASTIAALENAKQSIVAGDVTFPSFPATAVLPPLNNEVVGSVAVIIDDSGCSASYEGPDLIPGEAALGLDVMNATADDVHSFVFSNGFQNVAVFVAPPSGETRSGYFVLDSGPYFIGCLDGSKNHEVGEFTDLGEGAGFEFQPFGD